MATAVAMVAGAIVLARVGESWLDPQSLSLIFVVPIVLAAMAHGAGAALLASVLSVVAINFLFVEPRYTLSVARSQDIAALVLLGTVGGLVSIISDRARVAELARMEAARERFKSELLAGVSHDLRTPLSTILFTLQSLQRFSADHPEAARSELLGLAETQTRRLADLVDTLLASSRLEAGAMPVQLEATSVGDLVTSVLRDCELETRGLQIAVRIDESLPLVSADPALAARALSNVLLNAVRHARGAPIDIDARCVDHRVIVEIADRGPGLGSDPERLFDKFARGVAGDGRAPGLGLGLSLARSFMVSQGGTLAASNRAGGGAVLSASFLCWTKAVRDGG